MALENSLLTLINALFTLVFIALFWILPGRRLITNRLTLAKLDHLFLATSLGFASYAFVIFIVRLLGLPFWIGYIPFLILAVLTLRNLSFRVLTKPIWQRPTTAQQCFLMLAFVGMIIQGIVLFRSGVQTTEGMRFGELALHDSLWHIFLIDELKENFPPRHPGFAPVTVKNYHFLLDLTIASVAKYLPLSTLELYYRIMPAIISLLFSLGIFVVARRLIRSEWYANAAVFLTLFAGNASWIVKYFRGPEFHPSANTFMLDAILDLLQNPHAVVVFPLMLAGIFAMLLLEKKKDTRIAILAGIIFGVMVGFKAWGGILMFLALPLVAVWMSIKNRRHDFWIVWIMVGIVSAVIFLPVYDAGTAAGLYFVPGWLLKRMVEDPDRYNLPRYYFLEQYYREISNIPHLILLNLEQIAIFIFGNLWIRSIGLLALWQFMKKITPTRIFMVAVVIASLSLPLLFNQGRMSYDIIQFGPYSLVILSVLTPLVLKQFARVLPPKFVFPVMLILLALSAPSNAKSVRDRLHDKSIIVSNPNLEAYHYLKDETDPRSIVMVSPSRLNISTALVAALSHRPTYFSANTFSRITGEDYEGREAALRTFFRNTDQEFRNRIIKDNSVDYLLLSVEEDQTFNSLGLNLTKVFHNEEAVIYKFR